MGDRRESWLIHQSTYLDFQYMNLREQSFHVGESYVRTHERLMKGSHTNAFEVGDSVVAVCIVG